MRVSALLTCAFALLANASPQGANKECYNALRYYPAQSACSSFLRTTITPCPKTKTTAKTSTKATTTATVTIPTTTFTLFKWKTVTVTSKTTITVPAQPTEVLSKRKVAAPTCPSSSKPTKVPADLSKRCDGKAFSSACMALGFKPKSTTLAASTATSTITVFKTVTSTSTVALVSVTDYKWTTTTVTVSQTSTVTESPTPDVESCFYLVVPGEEKYLSFRQSSGESPPRLGADKTQFKLSDGRLYTTVPGSPRAMARTSSIFRPDGHPSVDFLQFSNDFEDKSLTCRIAENQLHCDSTSKDAPNRVRSTMVSCEWQAAGTNFKRLALSGEEPPAECTAFTLELSPCEVSGTDA